MTNVVLEQVGRMMTENRIYEMRIGYERLIEDSRLPKVINVRHGFKTYTYTLQYGQTDERAFISYQDKAIDWKKPHKVLMHYEESTMKECITKAWRKLAENRVKL